FLPICLLTALVGIPIAAWLEQARVRTATHLLACAGAFATLGFIWAVRPALHDSALIGTRNLQDQLLSFTLMGTNLGLAWSALNLWNPPLPNWEIRDA
ncbi:MAG: hypothetical protein ABIR60_09595, partial [Allosphingosinicella sp.]